MREKLRPRDLVADLLSALLRHNVHRHIRERVTAVTNHSSERRNAIGIPHHLSDVALHLIIDLRTRGPADRHSGGRDGSSDGQSDPLHLHYKISF